MNIVQFTALASKNTPGLDPMTPAWEATARLQYGLPLHDDLMPIAEQITHRSAEDLRSLKGHEFDEVCVSVGRRGRKTSTAGAEAGHATMFGEHEAHLAPGERGLIALISKDLASTQLAKRSAQQYLRAVGVESRTGRLGNVDLVRVPGARFDIACLTQQAVRGYAIPVAICDEIAHWSSDQGSACPDSEVLAALRPAMAQFPRRKLVMISSPLAQQGEHYRLQTEALGNATERRILAVQGATWVFNPSITEQQTRELERDQRVWRREYLAVPQSAALALLDADAVDRCFTSRDATGMAPADPVIGFDASAGKGDSCTAVVARWVSPDTVGKYSYDAAGDIRRHPWGDPIVRLDWKASARPAWIRVDEVWGLDGVFWTETSAGQIVDQVAALARRYGARKIVGDQYNSFAFKTLFSRAGLSFTEQTWTGPSKANAVGLLRRLVADGQLELPPHDKLRTEMLSFEERITPSGTFSYDSRRHADYLASILTLLMHEQSGGMPRTPNKPASVLKVGRERLWF